MQFPRFLAAIAALSALVCYGRHVHAQQLAPGGVLSLPPGNPVVIENGSDLVTGTATVRYQSFEGGFYSLETDAGSHYDPTNLPVGFRRDGVRVGFEGRLRVDLLSVHQYGQILEPTSVTGLFPSPGSYVGAVRRVTPDGQRQDSTVRLLVGEDGTVYGTLYLAVPNRVSPIYLLGKVDQNGVGSFKTRQFDPSGSDLILPDPDAEKMPLLFFRDGRVVGGSLDRNGVSLTFRARFEPPTNVTPAELPAMATTTTTMGR